MTGIEIESALWAFVPESVDEVTTGEILSLDQEWPRGMASFP